MAARILDLLRGEVAARVVSGFPERVLNLCAEYGLRFRSLRWISPAEFTFTLTRRDWKRLRRLTKDIDCELTAVGWRGAPFFLGRLRRRYALWIALAVCSAALFWGSFFIWDIRIEGNETVPDQEILQALEAHGVGFGTYGYAVNSFELRNYILLDIPELSYIAVNVRGCRAYVQVRERVPAPELVSKRAPGNTVAAKDALVTAIEPWDGEKQVLPGTMVKAGDLLISGVVESDFAGARYLRGMGKVYGRTWYSLRCKVPLTVRETERTGETVRRRALLIGKKRINLYFNSSIPGDTYDKIVSRSQWSLPGLALPAATVTETYFPCAAAERTRSVEEALAAADLTLTRRLAAYLAPGGGEVLSRALTYEERDGVLTVTLSAECEEQIGKLVEIG